MCSKEAWEHFIYTPKPLPRRVARSRCHENFLSVKSQRVTITSHAERRSALAANSSVSYAATAATASAGVVAAAAAVMGAPLTGSAMMLKMAMMVPPPPQVLTREASEALALQGSRGGFLEMLFPNFETDTFIWRISMLQILEYIGSCLLGSKFGAPKLCSLYLLGASWGPAIAGGAVWRLFLPMMLHANALHIFFNIFFQLRIGFGMEKQFGRRKFCLLYLFCGFLGNLLSVVADPMKLAVGASTSGFGLLGVWAAEVLLTWDLLGESQPKIFLWFAFMILSCVMMSTISPNVDFMGHFGGALAGFLMAIILADMREEHRPEWYGRVKSMAKNATGFLIFMCLLKAIMLGPEGPIPFCGSIFKPQQMPF